MNPFILVTEPDITTLFNPVIGFVRANVGNVKNWISSDCIWMVYGKSMKLAVEVII